MCSFGRRLKTRSSRRTVAPTGGRRHRLRASCLPSGGPVSMRCVLTVHVVSILDVASRRVASSEASVSKRIARSSLCATSNNVGFGLEVVTFRLALAAERHRG